MMLKNSSKVSSNHIIKEKFSKKNHKIMLLDTKKMKKGTDMKLLSHHETLNDFRGAEIFLHHYEGKLAMMNKRKEERRERNKFEVSTMSRSY